MDWNRGFKYDCFACYVDRNTWRDMERIEIKDGQIVRSQSSLIESADVETNEEFNGEKWIRLYMDAEQDGATERVALFTGLAVAPTKDTTWGKSHPSLEIYSVLKPAEDVLLPRGYFIPAGMNGGYIIKNLLDATPAPVEIVGDTPDLQDTIIAEQNENHLTMVEKVLKAINRRIRIAGDGTVQIAEKAIDPATYYDALDNDGVEPHVSMTHDWFFCPNVFRAISDDQSVTVYDDREDSALSTVNRGREVWMEESNCNLNIGEGLRAYAQRRLREEQSIGYEVSYSRRFNPDITISDLVSLYYPGSGLDGNYMVTSQRISLGKGCRTEEQVEYW